MLPRVGTYPFQPDPYLTDFNGKVTLPVLVGYMLQAATKHAEERGFGHSLMKDTGKAWVLSRMMIGMNEYPGSEAGIKLHTWVADVNKLFTERCFAIENDKGKKIGYARSVWASIDLFSRRPTLLTTLAGLTDFVSEGSCPIDEAKKIPAIQESKAAVEHLVVKYSDIDINKHLNSIKYIEYFIDTFDLERFDKKKIKQFEINYLSEAQYGNRLDIFRQQDEDDLFRLEMKRDERIISTARITWE
jgi:Acyl-ACP thioesterase